MNSNHLLVKKAIFYEKNELKDPENCKYDDKIGAWLWGEKEEFLVKSDNPNCPKRGTKKFDVETGEDLKGE